jgi:hypothetical protein
MDTIKIEGIIFLIFAWSIIITLNIFCLYKVLKPKKKLPVSEHINMLE